MKRLSLLCILFLSTTFLALSQNLSFGIRGGLNVSNLSMSHTGLPDNQQKARTSFNIGGYGQYSLNEKMTIQTELFYSEEGASFSNPGTELPANINLSYLSLPLFFKYNIYKKLYAMAGPQVSYLLSAQSVYEDGTPYNVMNEHSKSVIGFVPVVGYDWKNFSINVRYNIGLTNIPKSLSYWNYTRYIDNHVKSNVFSLVVGYKIGSRKN
ncbi:MAG: hypothetical protein OJF59_001041 [Cytophagales bacterium]|jgi:hypothetical protein|nr:PorT family protein [Bacteroidota bacterium]MBS1979966.1 PorT family protein [Bacteroidota bacterium]WHZ07288.1 MAG: hypothetical protein OJF59_001041 [Cytophagales bacterium]